ncbi:MAG TPA: hypothetical protein VHA75_10825, partial [Rugosimonospora sp.]|nr:hypothetical protein [Rugosimonospora sp.]
MNRPSVPGRRRHAALAVLAAATTAVTLAACGGGANGTAKSGSTEIVVAGTYSIDTVDPDAALGGSTGPLLVIEQIYGRLLRIKADGTLEGDLATAWKPNSDATTWT